MKKYLTSRNFLLAILAIAFFLRFWNVWNYDLFGDEAVDAFRSIGYLDYLGTSFQTTPVEWYQHQTLPWWTKLSFHDFPPLAMIIMHGFFRIFGDSLLVARLPAVIAGTLSVCFLYLIVKKLFQNDSLALFSALFIAINSALVWVFRISMLEPILLFFILLNIYYFFQFLEDKRKWWFFGGTFGLVALIKYTGVFLAPVYFSYLILGSMLRTSDVRWTSDVLKLILKNWRLYAALALALLMFSPVIIYNFYLYQVTGHFDLQFAYLLGQETQEWKLLIGKTQAPFSDILKNLAFQRWEQKGVVDSIYPVGYYGISAIAAVLAGIIYSVFAFIQNRSRGILFFWLYFVFVTLLLTKIGSAHRFLTLYGPVFAFFVGLTASYLWNFRKEGKLGYGLKLLVAAFFLWQIFHSINTNFIRYPDYGMAKLDRYFEQEFVGKESAVIPESDNIHLNEVIYKFASKKSKTVEREFRLIVYNDNIELPTLDWIFYRRFFYHSTPALFVENFNKAISVNGLDYFKPFQIYFVQSTENTLLNAFKVVFRGDKSAAAEFENFLKSKGLQPERIIYGKSDLPMFRIYKFRIFDII